MAMPKHIIKKLKNMGTSKSVGDKNDNNQGNRIPFPNKLYN